MEHHLYRQQQGAGDECSSESCLSDRPSPDSVPTGEDLPHDDEATAEAIEKLRCQMEGMFVGDYRPDIFRSSSIFCGVLKVQYVKFRDLVMRIQISTSPAASYWCIFFHMHSTFFLQFNLIVLIVLSFYGYHRNVTEQHAFSTDPVLRPETGLRSSICIIRTE